MEKKLLWIILPVLIFVIIGFFIGFQNKLNPPEHGTTSQIDTKIEVEENDKFCETDNDCVYVPTWCSECSCGDFVNKLYQQKHIDKYNEACKNLVSKKCNIQCLEFAKCI